MRLGCCARMEDLPLVADAGCEFFEMSVSDALLLKADHEQFARLAEMMARMPIKPEAINSFLRMDQKLVGHKVNFTALQEHMELVVQRAADLGGELIVFGCGAARSKPQGYSQFRARQQLMEFVCMAGEVAAPFGMKVVVQPLRAKQSNMVNTLGQAVSMARLADVPSVGVAADLFHMAQQDEPVEDVARTPRTLAYAHIADPDDRSCVAEDDDAKYEDYLRALRHAGYDDRLCIDCGWRDIKTELEPAVAYLKRLWARVAAG